MKSYQDLLKEYTTDEIAESFVFPNMMNSEDTAAAMTAFKIERRRLAAVYAVNNTVQSALRQ